MDTVHDVLERSVSEYLEENSEWILGKLHNHIMPQLYEYFRDTVVATDSMEFHYRVAARNLARTNLEDILIHHIARKENERKQNS